MTELLEMTALRGLKTLCRTYGEQTALIDAIRFANASGLHLSGKWRLIRWTERYPHTTVGELAGVLELKLAVATDHLPQKPWSPQYSCVTCGQFLPKVLSPHQEESLYWTSTAECDSCSEKRCP